MSIINILWYFVILSFLGWLFGGIRNRISEKKFYSNGFLTLPVCPSYGFYGVICYVIFYNLGSNPFITFIGSALILSAFSVITGMVLEKVLGCKPWDFSNTKLSLGSYVSAPYALLLGLIGVFTVHMLIPTINPLLNLIPWVVSMIIVLSICLLMLIDFIFSLITVFKLRSKIKNIENSVSLTESGISEKKLHEVEENYKTLFANGPLRKRMASAFPELKTSAYIRQVSEKLNQIKRENMKEYEAEFENEEDKPFAYGLCFAKLFILFVIGSFLGTCIETIYAPFAEGHFELRVGVIYGPFIPVYGGGAVLLTVVLYKLYKLSDTLIFIISAFLGAFFEYVCSWFQETVLGTVSWDYSNMPLNINGRTSLLYACVWGFLGLIWVRYLYPFIAKWIEKIPKKPGAIITAFLTIFMLYNAFITITSVYRWEQRSEGIAPSNSFEKYLDEKYNNERMKRLFPHMRHSDDLEEIQVDEKRPNSKQ